MGVCFSQDQWVGVSDVDFSARSAPTASVISASGGLHEYALPITVSKVLEAEISSSSSSSSFSSRSSALFLCDSDALCYEELIPVMGSEERLVKDQIYFALPRSRQVRHLSASDMAALAVKASLALQKHGSSKSGRCRRGQISPVLEGTTSSRETVFLISATKGSKSECSEKPLPPPPPPPSVRKYRRSPSSRRFKRAVRSFSIRLSTIQEVPESIHLDRCCRS